MEVTFTMRPGGGTEVVQLENGAQECFRQEEEPVQKP